MIAFSRRNQQLTVAAVGLLALGVGLGMWLVRRSPEPLPVSTPNPQAMQPDSSGLSSAEEELPQTRPGEVAVYFNQTQQPTTPKVVTRKLAVPTASTVEQLQFALKELLEGPSAKEKQTGLLTEIPPGTRLLGIREVGQAIHVNLSSEFASGGGAHSMQQRVDELAKTIRSLERKRPIYLEIEGKPIQTLGGDGLEVQEPINQPPNAAVNATLP